MRGDLEARRCRRSASRCASARPTSSSDGAASTRRTASCTSPSASEKPNFWSSCAVAMNSWVCASTPTVARTSTRRSYVALGGERREPLDLVEGVDDDPPDPGVEGGATARRRDLLLPCSSSRSPGKPACSATASSPPVQTSRPSPSSSIHRATRRAEECLGRVEDQRPAERLAVVAAAADRKSASSRKNAGRAVLAHEVAHVVAAHRERARRRRARHPAARRPGRARPRSAGGPPRSASCEQVAVRRAGRVGAPHATSARVR